MAIFLHGDSRKQFGQIRAILIGIPVISAMLLEPFTSVTEFAAESLLQLGKGNLNHRRTFVWPQNSTIAVRTDARFFVEFFDFLRSGVVIPAVEKQYVAVPDGI
jgi:hypothetical protein